MDSNAGKGLPKEQWIDFLAPEFVRSSFNITPSVSMSRLDHILQLSC